VTRPIARILCPADHHNPVTIARIERDPDGTDVAVFWTRTLVGPNRVAGGRAAEEQDETRLRLTDERIARGRIPYVVTWCRRCRREWVLPMPVLQDAARKRSTFLAPSEVLP
jgi:hypothetical protein